MHYRNHVHKNKKNMHYFYFPLYFCGFTKNCPCDTCTLNALLCVSWYVWHLTTDQSQVISHSWYQITGGKHLLWHHLPAVESFTEFRQRLQKSNDKQIKLFWYTATFCLLHTNRDTHTQDSWRASSQEKSSHVHKLWIKYSIWFCYGANIRSQILMLALVPDTVLLPYQATTPHLDTECLPS